MLIFVWISGIVKRDGRRQIGPPRVGESGDGAALSKHKVSGILVHQLRVAAGWSAAGRAARAALLVWVRY